MHEMFSGKARVWFGAAVVLLAGAMLRVWFIHHANPMLGDPQIYGNIAHNLLRHHVYSFAAEPGPFPPTLIRLPGYPLFLAAIFLLFGDGNFAAALDIQVILDLLSAVLLAMLAKTLFGTRAGWFCLILACLCPFTANYTATPLTETLTLASITLALFSFDRWRRRSELQNVWVLGTGAALAVSLLLRPEQALLTVAILPMMVLVAWRRRGSQTRTASRWKVLAPALCALACVVLPFVPWTARNWHTFHLVQPLAPRYATDPGEAIPLGFQRWYRSWAIDFASTEEVYWNYDGTAIAFTDLPDRAFDSPEQRLETMHLLRDYNVTTNPSPQLDAGFATIAQQRIHYSPIRYYLLLPAARLANMLLRPRTELTGVQLAWWRWRDSHSQTIFATLYAALNALYLVLGAWGWKRWWQSSVGDERLLLWSMTAFVLLRCATLLMLDNSEPRYTLELFPILILCASALLRRRSDAFFRQNSEHIPSAMSSSPS